jgi:hypothetical protein
VNINRIDRQFTAARRWSNSELRIIAPIFNGKVVNVSAGDDDDKEGRKYADYFYNASSYELTNYGAGTFRGYQERPNEHLLDLTDEVPQHLTAKYDVALNHTTLEHIFDVRKAFHNLCELSRDIVIVIVPFAQVQHEASSYLDYWRFTPTCLRELFRENGMSVVYESESNTLYSSVYILMIGAREPERWLNILPTFVPLSKSANWIGQHRLISQLAAYSSRLWIRGRQLWRKKTS